MTSAAVVDLPTSLVVVFASMAVLAIIAMSARAKRTSIRG